jgi:hypothetical protein
VATLRSLAQTAWGLRERLANVAGLTFGGKRDIYTALGYQRRILPIDYRSRYKRNAVAARIVEAFPSDTWRGDGELVEDEDPKTFTQFEQAWEELNTRLRIWTLFKRADILAGIGRYSIILIGAPGNLDEPLEKVAAKDIAYLTPFAEEDATIERFDIDTNSPRFGQPTFYTIKRTQAMTPDSSNSTAIGKRAHWTRVIHVADGLLDDPIFGTPRLERCWNLLDDLEKVTGGGAEAFWNRSNQGTQFDIDPTLNPSAAELESLKEQVEKYKHGLDRVLTTRGLKINTLGSDVANFSNPIDAIISQICTGIGIPQRILMGSERGQLASTQDRDSWFERVGARAHRLRGAEHRAALRGASPRPRRVANGGEVRRPMVGARGSGRGADGGYRGQVCPNQ